MSNYFGRPTLKHVRNGLCEDKHLETLAGSHKQKLNFHVKIVVYVTMCNIENIPYLGLLPRSAK